MNPVLLVVVLLVGVGLGTLIGSSLTARRVAATGASTPPARPSEGIAPGAVPTPATGPAVDPAAGPSAGDAPAETPMGSLLPPPPALGKPAPMSPAPKAPAATTPAPRAPGPAAPARPAPVAAAAPPAHPAAPAAARPAPATAAPAMPVPTPAVAVSEPALAAPAASMAGRDLWTAPHVDLADEVAKVPRRRREDFLPEAERPAVETMPQAELPPGWTDPITGLPLAEAMRADIELRATDFRTFTVVVCHPMMAMTTPGGMVNVSPNAGYGEEELRVFASVLRDTLRQKDIVGRYDERLFLLFLPRCKVDEVRIVMDRIRGNLLSAQPNQPQWVDITYGAGAGEVGHSVDGPLKVAYADLLHRNAGPAWFLS